MTQALRCQCRCGHEHPAPVKKMLLTYRQRSYLILRANGYSAQEIADEYEVEADTVRAMLVRAYARLHAKDSAHAVAMALRVNEILPEQIVIGVTRRKRRPGHSVPSPPRRRADGDATRHEAMDSAPELLRQGHGDA